MKNDEFIEVRIYRGAIVFENIKHGVNNKQK
jgi:hypothetical protein